MIYVIRQGDSLSRIAQQQGTTVSALMAANPQIKNPNVIHAGANLNIPVASTPALDKMQTRMAGGVEAGGLGAFFRGRAIAPVTPTLVHTPAPAQQVSVVDHLRSIGQPSDFASRARQAAQLGIANYTGTAAQNTQLLNLLRGGVQGGVQPTIAPTPIIPTISPLVAPVIPAEELIDVDIKDPEPVVGTGVDQVALRIERTALAERAGFEQAFQDIRDMRARVFETKAPEPEKTVRELRTEILAEWGITPEAFQEIRNLTTKQKPLLDEMTAIKIEERELLTQTEGRMASMTWIRGEQRMIQERFESRRADVSAQLGALSTHIETLRGNFVEARTIANDMIKAAIYDQEREYKRYTSWYNRNWSFIQSLDKNIRILYDDYLKRVETNRIEAREEKRLIANLMLQNPRAGINIRDTFEEATQKVVDFKAILPVETKEMINLTPSQLRWAEAMRINPATLEGREAILNHFYGVDETKLNDQQFTTMIGQLKNRIAIPSGEEGHISQEIINTITETGEITTGGNNYTLTPAQIERIRQEVVSPTRQEVITPPKKGLLRRIWERMPGVGQGFWGRLPFVK